MKRFSTIWPRGGLWEGVGTTPSFVLPPGRLWGGGGTPPPLRLPPPGASAWPRVRPIGPPPITTTSTDRNSASSGSIGGPFTIGEPGIVGEPGLRLGRCPGRAPSTGDAVLQPAWVAALLEAVGHAVIGLRHMQEGAARASVGHLFGLGPAFLGHQAPASHLVLHVIHAGHPLPECHGLISLVPSRVNQ